MTFAAKGSRTAFARAATRITPLLVGRPSPVWSGRAVRRTKACGGRTCFEVAETAVVIPGPLLARARIRHPFHPEGPSRDPHLSLGVFTANGKKLSFAR